MFEWRTEAVPTIRSRRTTAIRKGILSQQQHRWHIWRHRIRPPQMTLTIISLLYLKMHDVQQFFFHQNSSAERHEITQGVQHLSDAGISRIYR